jgi:hypothetical protein
VERRIEHGYVGRTPEGDSRPLEGSKCRPVVEGRERREGGKLGNSGVVHQNGHEETLASVDDSMPDRLEILALRVLDGAQPLRLAARRDEGELQPGRARVYYEDV